MDVSGEEKKILVFELNWLGDILFSFPFLRAIRKKLPEAYISCAVVPRYADLLINNPWINNIHILSDDHGPGEIIEKIKFVNKIKKEKYDICFLLKPSRTKALMAYLSGIKTIIGFGGKKSKVNLTVKIPASDSHRSDQILSLAGALGVKDADEKYEYFINAPDAKRSVDILRASGGGTRPSIVINPGGNWDAKRWPLDKHKRLAEKMVSSFKNVEVIIAGSEKDVGLANEIVFFVNNKRCYSIAGKTNLNELASVFRNSVLVISADSGPMHMASAVGARTIVLFGPTAVKITGPRGVRESIIIRKDCGCNIPCYTANCGMDFACMRNITVDEVFRAAKKILLENGIS